MSEYYGSDTESDSDDGTESAPSTVERAPAREVGEILLSRSSNETAPAQHETIFSRNEAAEKAAAAAHFSVLAELSSETDDDDDEEDEGESKAPTTAPEIIDAEEAPDDHLSETEIRTVVEHYDAARSDELAAERAAVEPASVEDTALAANELFIEKIDEQLEAEAADMEAALDQAVHETEQAIDEAAASQAAAAEAGQSTSEADDEDPTPASTTSAGPSSSTRTGASSSSGSPTTGAGGAGGASGGMPPFGPPPGGTPPVPPYGGGPSPSFSYGGGPGGGATFNTYNAAPAGPALTPEDLDEARRHGETTGLVVGGILGYLIGRRRGRIKTEKRLLPIQEKLEGQVNDLHESIASKEQDIRRLASERFRLREETQRRLAIDLMRPTAPERSTDQSVSEETASQPATVESRVGNFSPPGVVESDDAEPYRSATTGQTVEIFKPVAPPPERHIEQVEQLSTKEMLKMSERVIIGGARLRDIYEAKQITEPGLKHILTEFLSGGDVKRALDQELLVKQMGYERDPQLRDRLSAGYSADSADAAAISGAASQAGPAAGAKASSHRPDRQADIPDESEASAKRTEKVIIGTWVAIIAALVVVAFWLMARHK